MWHFTKRGQQETRQESKLDQFFKLGDSEGLIRESIQNAIDAKRIDSSDPVRMRFFIGTKNKDELPAMFNGTDQRIDLIRKETEKVNLEKIPQSYPYILIEDFNTTGFTGSIDVNELGGGEGESFRGFWWEEGKSTKRKGGGGSHGVGKVTLSETSKSRMFFAYSKRHTDNDELLFGYCRMGGHRFEGHEYRDYARFGTTGVSTKEEPPLFPYSVKRDNSPIISFFKNTFLDRKDGTGVSILIPNIDTNEINKSNICRSIIRNFYLPIFKGILRVSVVCENDETVEFSKDSLKSIASSFCEEEQVVHLIQLLEWPETIGFTPSTDFEIDKFNYKEVKKMFSEDKILEMRNKYAQGIPVLITFWAPLYPVDGQKETGNFTLTIRNRRSEKDDKTKKIYDVFRGNVRIKDEKISSRHKYTEAILDVFGTNSGDTPNPYSEFLKYCEDPGHASWSGGINRRNEPDKYKRTEVWQKDFVRDITGKILDLLEGNEQEEINDFADDIFVLKRRAPNGRADDNFNADIDGNESVATPEPPQGEKKLFTISKIESGFKIAAVKPLKEKLSINDNQTSILVVACYEIFGASRAKWLKHYSISDFNFLDNKTVTLKTEGVEITNITENKFVFKINSPEFFVELTGFDINRDLHISATAVPNKEDSNDNS